MNDIKSVILILFLQVACTEPVRCQTYDHHVHCLSPELIKSWKSLGIQFSRPDYMYANVDSILKFNAARRVTLISMAYVYSSEEYGTGKANAYDMIKAENDYVFRWRKINPKRIKAYFGIDPLHDSALVEARRCIKILRMDGMKMHFNASQVSLLRQEHLEKVKPLFELASATRIPVLLHFDNSRSQFGEPDVRTLVDSILLRQRYVNLQIAHFGTSGGFNDRTKKVLDAFLRLYEERPALKKLNLFFDISAVCLTKDSEGVRKLTDAEFDELANYCRKIGFHRIVFGTDYPLYNANEYKTILEAKLWLTSKEKLALYRTKINK